MKKEKPATRVQCKECLFVHINPWNGHQAWCQATGNKVNPHALRLCSIFPEEGAGK